MELLKSSRRRSKLAEFAYIVLNVGLAVGILFIVLVMNSPWLAYLLAVLSKWRVLAVRPRFWKANILANTVDLIVSLSVVVLLYAAMGELWLQLLLSILYIYWLLRVKPCSRRSYMIAQAGIAVFLGVTALCTVSASWDVEWFVLGMWVIGYSAARHVLIAYEEQKISIYSLIWGFFLAELGWVAYHWIFVYQLPGFGGVKLVQLAVVATAMSFIMERAYKSKLDHGTVRWVDIMLPTIFSVITILTLVIFFNSLNGGQGGI